MTAGTDEGEGRMCKHPFQKQKKVSRLRLHKGCRICAPSIIFLYMDLFKTHPLLASLTGRYRSRRLDLQLERRRSFDLGAFENVFGGKWYYWWRMKELGVLCSLF